MIPIDIKEVAARFQGARKRSGDSYQCRCPCHDDRKASLTVTKARDGKILVNCHAGCSGESILRAVGLKWKDLCNDEVKRPRTSWKDKVEKYKGKKIEAVYNYTDEKGKYLYTKLRLVGKDIVYGVIQEDKNDFAYSIKGKAKTLYNLPELLKAIREGYPVYFVEGEKDVETLRTLGLTATTCGGVGDWKEEFSSYFTGSRLILLPDNDDPGKKLGSRIWKDTALYAHSRKSVIICARDKGDVTDYMESGGTKEKFLGVVENTEWTYAPWLYENQRGGHSINEGRLAEAVSRTLPMIVLGKKNQEKDLVYIYEHGVYEECKRNRIKGYIRKYIPAEHVRDSVLNNVASLIACPSEGVLPYEAVDTKEKYTNVRNGLVNVVTGELEPHTKKILSTIQLDCNYQKEYKEPVTFLNYIDDLCRDADGTVDQSKKSIMQEWTGLILSNVNVYRTKKSLFLYSLLGNTGKTQYINLMGEILGADNKASIPMQKMRERFELGNLYGKRLNAVGDQQADDLEDSSPFKSLTGGDDISVEPKGKQSFNYRYKGAMVFGCNALPVFLDDKGGHVFERMTIIECKNTIPEAKRDPQLLDKMLRERDGVYMWGLTGLRRLIGNQFKFTYSEAVAETTKNYRCRMDTLYAYISEWCQVTGDISDKIKKPEFEDAYLAWCEQNKLNPLKKKNIQERAEKIGIACAKSGGYWYYRKIKRIDFKEVTDSLGEAYPF